MAGNNKNYHNPSSWDRIVSFEEFFSEKKASEGMLQFFVTLYLFGSIKENRIETKIWYLN
jgi:hypothetical protein